MFLGLDSTDSVHGGCTTHVAVELWRALSVFGGRAGPRLVRLNPNVPYKTRGNGALCLEIGHGVGRKRLAGIVRGVELWAYRTIEEPTEREQREIVAVARSVIEQWRSPGSNTGFVATVRQPERHLYDRAVSEHVDVVGAVDGSILRWGDGRGVLGAVAAAAWPAERGTYELIAYRHPSRWGTKRGLPLGLGADLDAAAPSSFDNWDPEHDHLRVAPASPCPILAGIRATRADELEATLPLLDTEPVDSWMTFLTNQASGDHLRPAELSQVKPFDSARVHARVARDPRTLAGGHVIVDVEDQGGAAVVAAYEPTKGLRDAVRGLREGDDVLLEAASHHDPGRLALESLEILYAAPHREETLGCECGGSTPSKGRRAGRACTRCGKIVEIRIRDRSSSVQGRVTVPASVRRHLATPNGFSPERLRLHPGGIAA